MSEIGVTVVVEAPLDTVSALRGDRSLVPVGPAISCLPLLAMPTNMPHNAKTLTGWHGRHQPPCEPILAIVAPVTYAVVDKPKYRTSRNQVGKGDDVGTDPATVDLLALCAIKVDKAHVDWSLIAREARSAGNIEGLLAGQIQESSKPATAAREILRDVLPRLDEFRTRAEEEIERAADAGARLVTVLDDDYPSNLKLVPNLPPFLFIRGSIESADTRSVAVVGTRKASPDGIERAGRMARELVKEGVTVISGLARGIDAAAHTSAMENGGRTIAVLGTGILKCYPPENRALAEQITEHGALVSQFWPSSGPARWTFPRRNVVTSGISQGTIVIEASSTSGAKMQARLALEHGKKVFLIKSLVTSQDWAQKYVRERGAIEVSDPDDVMDQLADIDRVDALANQDQMAFEFA